MRVNTNYDLKEYTTVVVIFKSLLTKKILDLWIFLVTFVTHAAILLEIRKANLIALRLKCAKSSFEGHLARTLHRTPPSKQETRHPMPKREHTKWRGRAKWLGQGVKRDCTLVFIMWCCPYTFFLCPFLVSIYNRQVQGLSTGAARKTNGGTRTSATSDPVIWKREVLQSVHSPSFISWTEYKTSLRQQEEEERERERESECVCVCVYTWVCARVRTKGLVF